MKTTPNELEALIERAAKLRASGVSWKSVGQELDYHPDYVKKWPSIHRDIWQIAYVEAERDVLSEAAAEAILTLRQQARSDIPPLRNDALKLLVHLQVETKKLEQRAARTLRSQPKSQAQRIAEELEKIDDAHLESIIAELGGLVPAPAPGLPADAPHDRPGPD